MTEDGSVDTGYTGGDGGSGFDNNTGQSGNPAWQEFLNVVPEEFHPQVTPVLEKWDKGVQDRFTTVQQQYEPYKAWEPFVKQGVNPEEADFALRLLNGLNENPQMVYNAIKDFYNLDGSDNSQGQEGPLTDEVNPLDPRISQLERQNEIMAQHLLNNAKQAELAQAEAELDHELSEARKKHGDFDEKFVLAYMQNGYPADEAAKAYMDWQASERAKFGAKPLIMGSGGGAPQFNTDVRKLDDKQTKNLVVQMLQAHAAEQNR